MLFNEEIEAKVKLAQTALATGLGVTAGYTVKKLLKQNIEVDKPYQKVAVWLGCYAIGGYVSYKVNRRIMDDAEEMNEKIRNFVDQEPFIAPPTAE